MKNFVLHVNVLFYKNDFHYLKGSEKDKKRCTHDFSKNSLAQNFLPTKFHREYPTQTHKKQKKSNLPRHADKGKHSHPDT